MSATMYHEIQATTLQVLYHLGSDVTVASTGGDPHFHRFYWHPEARNVYKFKCITCDQPTISHGQCGAYGNEKKYNAMTP